MSKEFMKAISHGKAEIPINKYSLTVEEIQEMDAARARGEISEIEYRFPSLTEQLQKAGLYGKMALEQLKATNVAKFLRIYSDMTIGDELVALADRVEKFKDEMWEQYERPRTSDPMEIAADYRRNRQLIEERIFEEIIKPFCEGN